LCESGGTHLSLTAFCDEEAVVQRQEALAQQSISQQEVYSEQRSTMRTTTRSEETHSTSMSAEAQEWQSMVRNEARKSAVSYAQASHFNMVSTCSLLN
jgi:hypothetical protein